MGYESFVTEGLFEPGECMNAIQLLFISLFIACGDHAYDCETDADCVDGEECVITHDHEGDDHDHGGTCEAVEGMGTAE